MQTPSDQMRNAECGVRNEQKPRSVFGNFKSKSESQPAASCSSRREEALNSQCAIPNLQCAIDTAVARSFLYRFLAKAYEYPTDEGWSWLCNPAIQAILCPAVNVLAPDETAALHRLLGACSGHFQYSQLESFESQYVGTFGHAARGSCPLNEIEYGDLKADALFQPHRLADLAAFYRAFSLEVTADAGERHDHICLELEFMSVLAAKEAYALEHQPDDDELVLVREAQKKFLREHLGRWTPAFTRRLARGAGESLLGALACFTNEFISADCHRFDVTPGSEDLLLRPVDESSESLCTGCGIQSLPPGALATTQPV